VVPPGRGRPGCATCLDLNWPGLRHAVRDMQRVLPSCEPSFHSGSVPCQSWHVPTAKNEAKVRFSMPWHGDIVTHHHHHSLLPWPSSFTAARSTRPATASGTLPSSSAQQLARPQSQSPSAAGGSGQRATCASNSGSADSAGGRSGSGSGPGQGLGLLGAPQLPMQTVAGAGGGGGGKPQPFTGLPYFQLHE
jgi:hypothetical protein